MPARVPGPTADAVRGCWSWWWLRAWSLCFGVQVYLVCGSISLLFSYFLLAGYYTLFKACLNASIFRSFHPVHHWILRAFFLSHIPQALLHQAVLDSFI